MPKHRYYRSGLECTADEALDARNRLKDGYSLVVSTTMRDHKNDDSRVRIVDGTNGVDINAGSRPGFRISTDTAARAARARIYDAYNLEQQNAWRLGNQTDARKKRKYNRSGGEEGYEEFENDPDELDAAVEAAQNSGVERSNQGHVDADGDHGPTGFGEKGEPRKSQPGDSCSLNGWPGVIVRGSDSKLFCQINDPTKRAANYSPSLDHKTTDVAKLQKDKATMMEPIYQELADALSNAWRQPL